MEPIPSERAAHLVARLEEAAERLISVAGGIGEDQWGRVVEAGVWSLGKEVEHVADAAISHQWIVRLTIGEKVSSRRPAIERATMTPRMSRDEAMQRVRAQTAEGVALLRGLTDGQLDLVTRPPRAGNQRLAETIERVLIGHYDAHRTSIEPKLATSSRA